MRILFCNKYNYPFSGTETYILQAMELLRARGHETALFSMADERGAPSAYDRHLAPRVDFRQEAGAWAKAIMAMNAVYSWEARRRLRSLIADFRPDIAHVRNIYHHLSPSILWELKSQRVPVIYHLNDFKVLCPNYNFVSGGECCEACKGGAFWHMAQRECYPGGDARAVLIAEAYTHKWLGTYRKCVDLFLAPSEFVRDKFVEHGWDSNDFQILHHFQPLGPIPPPPEADAAILYFGRLSREKGIDDLLAAMRRLPGLRLVIAGGGPDETRLKEIVARSGMCNAEFAGKLLGPELDRTIAGCRFSVFPSHAYETFGKTILESYARRRAVVATDLGSRRELVQHGKTGLLYRPGDVDGLTSTIAALASNLRLCEEMGVAGHLLVQQKYDPQAHYEALVGIYESVTAEARSGEKWRKLYNHAPTAAGNGPTPGASAPAPLQLPIVVHKAVEPCSSISPYGDQKIRVAFIGGRGVVSKYSGIETYYEEIGRRLAERGHEITAYCRSYFTPPGRERNGMRIIRLPTIRSKHLETLIHTMLSTSHVLAGRYDIVHYHALGPALFSFVPRLLGKKTVVTVQGLDWQRQKWGRFAAAVLRIGEFAASRLPNQTVVVSRTLQQYYRERHRSKIQYVPNGGMLRGWHKPNKILDWGLDPGTYILFLGRFSPEKGCHLLVEAYEHLRTDVKLVMAGAASYCDQYACDLRKHASERILMLDWVSGDVLDELLTNSMVFVLPSEIEGLSLALLDAMGAGICVLASDVPENVEAIADAGLTFRRGDAADLAARLAFLIANPAVREAAGAAAKRRVREHYQWENIASEMERVYFEVLGRPGVAPRKPSASVPQGTSALTNAAG